MLKCLHQIPLFLELHGARLQGLQAPGALVPVHFFGVFSFHSPPWALFSSHTGEHSQPGIWMPQGRCSSDCLEVSILLLHPPDPSPCCRYPLQCSLLWEAPRGFLIWSSNTPRPYPSVAVSSLYITSSTYHNLESSSLFISLLIYFLTPLIVWWRGIYFCLDLCCPVW